MLRTIRYVRCWKQWAIVLLPLAMSFAWSSTIASAQTTIHVPSDQSTIQAGIDAAQDGDTVFVSPGTYNENIDFKGKSLAVTTGATSFSDTMVGSTIINGSTDGPVVTLGTNEPTSAVLNGFTIRNGHASVASGLNGGGVFISDASPQISNNVIANNIGCGIHIVNLASPLIEGNDIKQSTSPNTPVDLLCNTNHGGGLSGMGIAIERAGAVRITSNIIENNVISETYSSSPGCGAALYINAGQQVLLQNNIIRNNHSACVPGVYSAVSPSVLSLIQNLIYDNTPPNGASYPEEVEIFGANAAPYPSLTEINNTIYGEGQELIYSFAPSTIANNIFFNTVPFQTDEPVFTAGLSCIGVEALSITFSANDIFNSGSLQSGGCSLGPGNLAVDPQFLNASGDDFHTQRTSPVVAAGDINAPMIPSTDLYGKNRTVCGTIDMGVYEVHPQPPIALTVSPNPAPGQSSVTLTAALTGNCNMPTGLITFMDGNTVLGTATLNGSAVAAFSTSFLFVGTHTLTATYPGDFNFAPSTSNTISEVITGPPSKTILTSVSPNPATPFQQITMTATVSSAYTTPAGTVTFMSGGTTLATVAVAANGTATATISTLGAGTYPITAVYSGSTEYAASTSNVVVEVINPTPAVILTSSLNPAPALTSITFTAQLPAGSGGTFIFNINGQNITTTPNAAGFATTTISTLTAGSYLITADWFAAGHALAAQASLTQVVTPPVAVPDFSLTGANITFKVFHSGTGSLELNSLNNFAGSIALTCNPPYPANYTCTLQHSSITLAAGATSVVGFTLNYTETASARTETRAVLAALFPLTLLSLIGLGRKRRNAFHAILSLALLAILTTATTACGPDHFIPITTSTFPIAFTATGTSQGATTPITHTVTIQATITP